MTRVAVLQSNYLPWRGYFDMMAAVDVFVLYDTVQFTKRDWRNRNVIKTETGPKWLTVPVTSKGKYFQTIEDTAIADNTWARRHCGQIGGAYRRAPHFQYVQQELLTHLETLADESSLSAVNHSLLGRVKEMLGITTVLLPTPEVSNTLGRTERLAAICEKVGATTYVSGPAAQTYLDETVFRDAGIGVEWFSYNELKPYEQMHGEFDGRVSVVDLLAHCGPESRKWLVH